MKKVIRAFLITSCSLGASLGLISCGAPPEQVTVAPVIKPNDKGSVKERRMAGLLRGHPKQRRASLTYDARLAAAARARARDMARRAYFGHVDPDGRGPNWHVTRAGYRLPLEWTAFKKSNQVESILGGEPTARGSFRELVNSSGHRSHLLASGPFYKNHLKYGVGYAYDANSPYQHYWVIITAPPEKKVRKN